MTEEEKSGIVHEVIETIKGQSQDIAELPVSDNIEDFTTLPAVGRDGRLKKFRVTDLRSEFAGSSNIELVQETGQSEDKAMSQKATTAAITKATTTNDGKNLQEVYEATKSLTRTGQPSATIDIAQELGEAADKPISQKAVSAVIAEIEKKARDNAEAIASMSASGGVPIAQEAGDSATSVMSQAAVTKALKNVKATTEDGKSLEDVYGIVKGLSENSTDASALREGLLEEVFKVAESAVTINKSSEGLYLSLNKAVTENGVLVDNSGTQVLLVRVAEGDNIQFSSSGFAKRYGYAFYTSESEDSYISGTFKTDTYNTVAGGKVSIPNGAKYMRLTWAIAGYDSQNILTYKPVERVKQLVTKRMQEDVSALKRENDAINDKLTKNSEQLSVDPKENIALVPSLACEIAYAGNVGEVMKRQYMSRNDSYVGIALQVVAGEKYIASGVVTYILSTSEYRVLEKKDNVVADNLLIEIPADAENLFIHFKKSEAYSLYKPAERSLKGIVTDLVKSDNDTKTVDLSTVQFIQGYSIYDRSWRKQNSSYVVDVSDYSEVEIITGFNGVAYALLQSVDYNNSTLFATGEGRSKNIPANTTQTILFPYDANFLVLTSKDGMSNTLPLKITLRKVDKVKYPNEVSYKDCGDVLVFGSSITEAALAPTSWAWIERLNDMIDAGLINLGRSGSSLQHNITTLLCNSSKVYSVGNVRQDTAFPLLMRTPFVMWNNDANGTPIGKKYTELLEKAYYATKAFGAKMLIGGEPWPDGALGNWNSRDYAKRAFLAAHKDVAGVVMSNYVKSHFIYEGYKGFSDTTFHPGFRLQTAMMCSYDFLKLLPLAKSVKMYKVRPTYYDGNPTLEQLTYDSTEERVKYFYAIGCGSQKGGNEGIGLSTAHADNSDFYSGEGLFDVPNGVNSQYGLCEIGELKKGRSVPFKNWALTEFILDKVLIGQGTFEITSDVKPTAVYVAVTLGGKSDAAHLTSWKQVSFDYIDGVVKSKIGADEDDSLDNLQGTHTSRYIQLYDKVRILVKFDGNANLSKPRFYDYDGETKQVDTRLSTYKPRLNGAELNDKTSVESGWELTDATIEQFPEAIRSYPKRWTKNETNTHIELPSATSKMEKTIAIPRGTSKVAVKVECCVFPKIATTRPFNGQDYVFPSGRKANYGALTESEKAKYINTDSPTIKEYDYVCQDLVLTVNEYHVQKQPVQVGWQELYFEVDLNGDEESLALAISKEVSWANSELPMLVYNVSIQKVR